MIYYSVNQIRNTSGKNDVSRNFEFQKQGPTKRAVYYCVQDCALCHTIINKLQIITNKGMEMYYDHCHLSFYQELKSFSGLKRV